MRQHTKNGWRKIGGGIYTYFRNGENLKAPSHNHLHTVSLSVYNTCVYDRSEYTSRSYNMRESVIYLKWLNNLNYLYAWKSKGGWFYR